MTPNGLPQGEILTFQAHLVNEYRMVNYGGPRLLLVTDHSFWLRDRGDRQRISSLAHHLSSYSCLDLLYLCDKPLLDREKCQITKEYHIQRLYEIPTRLATSSFWLVLLLLFCRIKPLWGRKILLKVVWARASADNRVPPSKTCKLVGNRRSRRPGEVITRIIRRLSLFNIADYDAIFIEYLRLTQIAHAIKKIYPTAKYLVDTHDVLYLRELAFQRHGMSTGVSTTKEQEKELLSHYDAIIGITKSDCQEFLKMQATAQIICASHAYTKIQKDSTLSNPIRSEHGRLNILYIGTGGIPNIDAVSILVREIVPILDRLTSMNYTLHIAGDICNTMSTRELSEVQRHANIRLHGVLPENINLYKNVDIVCNPVRFGGGIKIKNIEAIANHCVLVTTSEGARGLPVYSLPYYVCSDNPDVQALAISQFINSPSLVAQFKSRTVNVANLTLSSPCVYGELDRYILSLAHASDHKLNHVNHQSV